MCFCFNDTATTEIYTYLHTLSLHDALPIFTVTVATPSSARSASASAVCPASNSARLHRKCRIVSRLTTPALSRVRRPWSARSEEHTSELQSLMRISYAVVCLKKKHHGIRGTFQFSGTKPRPTGRYVT